MSRNPEVASFLHAPSNTWSYVVSDPTTRTAAIIDPVLDFDASSGRIGTTSATALLDHVERNALQVRWVLETHAHADHLSAGQWLKDRLPDAALAIGAGIREVQARFRALFNADFATDGSQFDRLFADGETFQVGTRAARVIAVPGHTLSHVAYVGHGLLFCGDTLFSVGCGRLFEGTPAQMWNSLSKLAALAPATRAYCGHEYTLANLRFARAVEPGNGELAAREARDTATRARNAPTVPSTIADERATNPFLRAEVPAVRAAAEAHAGRALPDAVAAFAELREWKNTRDPG